MSSITAGILNLNDTYDKIQFIDYNFVSKNDKSDKLLNKYKINYDKQLISQILSFNSILSLFASNNEYKWTKLLYLLTKMNKQLSILNDDYVLTKDKFIPYLTKISDTDFKNKLIEIFLKNRHILYLNQYLTIYPYIKNKSSNQVVLITKNYNNTDYLLKNINNTDTNTIIKTKLYSNLLELSLKNTSLLNFTIPKIKDILFLNAHGTPDETMFIVPKNTIVCFIAPLNKLGLGNTTELIYKELKTEYKKNTNFANNPQCYLKDSNYFKFANYYFPGQIIPNLNLTFNNMKTPGIFNINNKFVGANNLLENIINEYKLGSLYIGKEIYLEDIMKGVEGNIIYLTSCRLFDYIAPEINTSVMVEAQFRIEFINKNINYLDCFNIYNNKNGENKLIKQQSIINYNLWNEKDMHRDIIIYDNHIPFYDPYLTYDYRVNNKFIIPKHLFIELNDNPHYLDIIKQRLANYTKDKFDIGFSSYEKYIINLFKYRLELLKKLGLTNNIATLKSYFNNEYKNTTDYDDNIKSKLKKLLNKY